MLKFLDKKEAEYKMFSIIIKEFKLSRKSLFLWSLVLVLTATMGALEYPLVFKNTEMVMSGINAIPRIVQIMFGVDGLDFSTALDYYITMYYYYTLIAFLFAANLGYNIIYKEEKYKTAEFLYTKPISREKIILSKIVTGLVNVFILAAVTASTGLFILLPLIEAPNLSKTILITTSGMFFSQIVFFSIGVLSAAIFRKNIYGQIVIYGFVLFSYILSILIQYFQTIDFLNFLTPFQYFPVYDVSQSGLSFIYIILALGLSLVLLLLSIKKYKNKDLYV